MVPAGDHMEIRETSRSRSPILLQEERVGLQVNWLLTGVGRAYLAYCPAKERQQIIESLRAKQLTRCPRFDPTAGCGPVRFMYQNASIVSTLGSTAKL